MSAVPHRSKSSDLPHAHGELMSIKKVAAIVKVPEATLRYWRHLGSSPRSFRVGRCVRYWRTDVALWLETLTNDPESSR